MMSTPKARMLGQHAAQSILPPARLHVACGPMQGALVALGLEGDRLLQPPALKRLYSFRLIALHRHLQHDLHRLQALLLRVA